MRTAAVAALLALLAGTARATTFVGMNERTLARAADAIVIATVARIESVADGNGAIDTLVTLEVEQELKGTVGTLITLKETGGSVGGRLLWIAGSPRFSGGERQLLFLSAHRDGTARTTALGLGQFSLSTDRRTGRTVAERTLDEPVLGTRPVRRVPLARLVRTIERAVAADAGRAVAPLVTAPRELFTPGLERETVDAFTLMQGPSARWFEADDGQPIAYQVDQTGDKGLGASASLAAVDAALAAWTIVTGASVVLQRGGDAAAAPLQCDGLSQIVFNDPFDDMPKPVGCSGVLALGGYCTSSATEVVNGIRFNRITEGNITFNNGFTACPFWNQTNLAEVATHELGHTIGIGHSSEDDGAPPDLKDATMYYRAHFDGRGAALRADDVAAIRFVYPGPGGVVDGSEDGDGDGIPDAQDDCPGIANPVQTDTDGDSLGDLCDPCPLVAGTGSGSACLPIHVSKLHVTLRGANSRLVWRGTIDLPRGVVPEAARALLVNGTGVVVDTSLGAALRPAAARPGRLRYRSDRALVTLRPAPHGGYRVRVAVRGIDLGSGNVPIISASLQVGDTIYAASLSCSQPRGHRLTCRG